MYEKSTILIASSAADEGTWRPVYEKLDGQGFDLLLYEADKVADASIPLSVYVNNTDVFMNYNNHVINMDNVVSAWYRRPTLFSTEEDDRARQQCLDLERNVIQHALWNMVREDAWMSSPSNINKAEKKLTQLIVASEIGFKIPETVISNSWESVTSSLHENLIFKPSYGMFYDQSGPKLLYVAPLSKEQLKELSDVNPFPGFWQPYLEKSREWRITIVGDDCFDASIYTENTAKDDWRRHQLISGEVIFKTEKFPERYKVMCFEYLRAFNLRFGAFDFIEDYDGQITFLECNANGQYGWLEDELDLPISSAVASELLRIARRN